MDAVNLLPLEYRERKRRRSAPTANLDGRKTLRLGGGVALFFAVALGALFFHEHQLVSSKTKELANNKAQIAAVQPQVDAITTAQAAVSGRLAFAKSVTSTRMNWDKALNDFARIIPTSSYLSSISVTAPVTAATAAAAAAAPTTLPSTGATGSTDATVAAAPAVPSGFSTLTLAGVAPSTPGVALVMDRLSLLPWLSNVTLASASRTDTGSNTFNMTANVSEAH
jgi:Tfp pilus assembly protein PilN